MNPNSDSGQHFRFNGLRIEPVADVEFLNCKNREWSNLEEFGFSRIFDMNFGIDAGVELHHKDSEHFVVTVCLDGSRPFFVDVGGFDKFLEFNSRYLTQVVSLVRAIHSHKLSTAQS